MNHIYRLCWNRTLRAWVPASELAKSKGAGTSSSADGRSALRVSLMLSLLAASLAVSGLAWAGSTPTGGQVVGGSGSITQSGNVTTIRQNSQTLSLNWQSFDIGANQTVDFLQPGSSSIAVNRILGNTASDIEGHLNSNGQVWLINPNGVLFGKGAQVNVGGIVASTLDFDQSTLGTGSVRFSGNGKGSVVNLGTINVKPGGYAALLGNMVSNQGTIRAQLGTVALAGGTAMTLTFADNQLVHLVVNANAVQSLVENRQLIVADGGQVLMTAGARNSLIDSAVNNTGTVQAQTVQDHNGTITLLGGMQAGTVNVAGTLDASAPSGGNGGFIETSGAQVHIADGATITSKAPDGKDGTWLVDPTDFTIAASGGDITASTLENQLASGNVALTSDGGAGGTSGNVNVNQAVTWSANTNLTLTASNNVNLNAAITNTGASGKTVLNAGNAFVNKVGASGLGGNWAIYSASPTATGETLGGLTPDFIQYNAPAGTAAATGATGNGVFYTIKPTLTVTGLTGIVTKSYDGSTTATLAGNNITDSGLINGDTISSATGTYSQSDVGTGITVTSPSSINAFDIVNGNIPVYGYTLSGTGKTANIGTINAAQLYATVIGNPTKVYDGSTTATLASSNYYITGLATGQSLTVNQPSSVGYASADVNTNGGTTPHGGQVAVDATFASANFVAGSGTKLSNYILPTATSTTAAALAADSTAGYGTITPAPVYLSGVQASNKTYDATTNDLLDISNASIYGIVNGDNVTLDTSGATGNFASPNAGNNLAVTLSGFTLTGSNATKVADYALIAPTNLTANIYKKALTVAGVTATNKVYDGTTTDPLNTSGAVLSGFVNAADQTSTTLSTNSATGTFSQADVRNGLGVTVSGLIVDNSNYSVTQPTGLTANITPATLTIAFSGSADKIYDGTSYATLPTGDFTVTGMVPGQTVSVNQAPAIYTDDKGVEQSNVGSYTATATLQSSDLGFTNGAKAGNYIFNTAVSGTGHITPAPLTLTITGNLTRAYDGASDTSATLDADNFTLRGVISGQSITLSGPFAGHYYDTSNSAAPGSASYEGNAGTWGVVSTLAGSNYVPGSGTLLSNYTLPTTALGYGTIKPAGLTEQLVTGASGSKVYDGTNTIDVTGSSSTNPGSVPLGSAVLVLGGVQSGDSNMTLSTNLTGKFASANVGSQPLSVDGITAADFTCNGCSANWQDNYTFPESVTGTGTILAKNLYITLTGVTKQYNGNTAVLPLTNGNFTVYGYGGNDTNGTKDSGWVSGEGATITPTASFTYSSPNVVRDTSGTVLSNKIGVTGTLTQGNYTANGNTLLSNYNLVYNVSGVGTITPAPLYVNGVYAQDKIYDGDTGALVNISNGQLAGLADVDKNANAITLTVGNSSSTRADGIASNASGTIVANKNGSFTATYSPVGGMFASADAGKGQGVTTTFSLGGSSAGNYTLESPALTASITPRPLTVSGITANDKAYDGTTDATFTSTTPTFSQASGSGTSVSGLLTQDNSNVSLDESGATGTFATANANADTAGNFLSSNGQPITVTASGFTLGGSAASNYVLSQPSGLSANIKQAQITLALEGPIQKVYDGSTSITIPTGNDQSSASTSAGYHSSGWVSGEGASITQTHSASYNSADATVDGDGHSIGGGNGLVNVTAGLVSSDWQPTGGTLLSNYALPTTVTGDVGVITPLVLNLSATRVYDATANIYASLSGNVTNNDNANVFGTLSGLNGDKFTVTGQGNASSKNVGTYTGTNFSLGTLALQADSGNTDNYTLVGGVDTYTITKAPLNISGATVTSKTYNASTTATVTGATVTQGATVGDVLGSDAVTVSSGNIAGTFASANANAGLTGTATTPTVVTINSADITGADAKNYSIVQPSGLAGTINQAPVTIAGVRQYNGNATAAVVGGTSWTVTGTVGTQTLKVASGAGNVTGSNSPNVGTYSDTASTFSVDTLKLGNGSNGGLASNYAIATGGNQFTINPFQINLTGSSTYNGSTTAGATSGSFTGVNSTTGAIAGANGETLVLGGSYTLANGGNVTPNGNGGGTANKLTTTTPTTGGSGLGGLTLADGGGSASNYVINSIDYTVSPVVLSFKGSKAYDGSSAFSASTINALTGGLVGSDQLVVGGTGALSSANAGSYGTGASGIKGSPTTTAKIGVGGLTLSASTGNSANPDNYTLVGGNDTYDITKAVITLTGVRQYDGTTAVDGSGGVTLINGTPATCTVGSTCWGASTSNVYTGDLGNLTVASNSSTVSSQNVGTYNDNNGGGFNDALTLGGSAAANYTLAATGNQFIINPYVISLAGTRVYDAKTDADAGLFGNMDGTIDGVTGEVLSLTGSGVVSSKNVNGGVAYTGTGASGSPTSGQGFNLGTLALGDNTGNAGNYTLVGGSDSLAITKATLTVTGTTVADKTYNGLSNDAALSGSTLVDVLSDGSSVADQVTLGNDSTGTYASANAGTEAVSTGMTISGADAANYTLVQPVGVTGLINKAALKVTAKNASKTYDGKAYSGGNGVDYNGFVNGETASVLVGNLAYGGTSQNAINAGNYDITASGLSSGNYAISYVDGELDVGKAALKVTAKNASKTYDGKAYSGGNGVDYSGFVNGETASVLGGSLAYGGTSQGAVNAGSYGITASGLSSGNYAISYVDGALDVGKAALKVTAKNASKTYDGQAYSGGNGVDYNGFVNGETASVLGGSLAYGGTSQGAVNAGSYGITASGLSGGNYAISYVDGVLDVGKAILNLSGARVYDAGTDADAGQLGISGLVGNQTVALSGVGQVGDKNVGSNKPFASLGTLALADGSHGGLASNYTLAGGTDTLTITPKAITVDAAAADKTYDGDATAAVTSLTSGGVIGSDTVSFADTAATFADANAGTAKTVTVSGITASGTDAGNYTINNTATTTADINKAVLSLSGTRVYDGGADASAGQLAISGLAGNEKLVLSGVSQVADKNVGTDKPLTSLGTLALADGSNGGLASNYTLTGGTDTLTITPATLTIAGTTVADKTYNGQTNDAVLSGSTLQGVLDNDGVTLGNDSVGTYISANAGTEAVSTGMTIGGADADNYTLVQPAGVTGLINKAVLSLSGTRVYDASTDVDAGDLTTINGLVGNETVVLNGVGQVGDKNVGSNKSVTSLGTLALADGSNGGLSGNYTLVGGVDTLSITPKTIVADATGSNKIYDGNTLDTVALDSAGVIAGDSVQFGYGAANFADPNIGNNKVVTISGVQLSGADAGNYLLASPTVYTHADITGARPSAFGISNGTLASVDSVLGPTELATPYGLAPQDTVGEFTGNKKRLHHPVERNVSRGDFSSGLALKVIDGGVREPVRALP